MDKTEQSGCLGAFLELFGIRPKGKAGIKDEFPYRLRDDFLSKAEHTFYRALVNAVGNQAVICLKVNLVDLFFVLRPNENQSFRNKIDRKHVDFVLCDPGTMKPRCGIELDDSSHARPDRQERDAFVNQVFQAAGLPLIHVHARASYDIQQLSAMILPVLNAAIASAPAQPSKTQHTGIPTCPKCGVPMVKRVATKGQATGNAFYGCPNYPKCRETVRP